MSQMKVSEEQQLARLPELERKILDPYTYLANIPGKKIRTKLIESFNHWLKIPDQKLTLITDAIELLHNSSLLIDDIEDNSLLRRGMDSAHVVYGTPLTINAANLIYFVAMQKILELQHPDGARVFCEQMLELHQGQGMEIWFRDNYVCPNEAEYKQIVLKKTGGLFSLAIRLMLLFSSDKRDFKGVCDAMGLFFQIRDDFANLCSQDYSDAKSFCDDLTEGKFSYPVIHSMRMKNPNTGRLFEILKMRTMDVELKKEAIEVLKANGSFEYTVATLKQLKSTIFEEVAKSGGNPYLERLLQELCKMIE